MYTLTYILHTVYRCRKGYRIHINSSSRTQVSEYHLSKDGSQWGLVDPETQAVFYLFWPPWVRHRFTGLPHSVAHAQPQSPQPVDEASREESTTLGSQSQYDNTPAQSQADYGLASLRQSGASKSGVSLSQVR